MDGGTSRRVLVFVAGGILFVLGVAVGVAVGGGRTPTLAAEPASPRLEHAAEFREVHELLEALTKEVRALRADSDMSRTGLAASLERLGARAPVTSPSPEVAERSARVAIEPPASGTLEEILARLNAFETTQRTLLAVEHGATRALELRVPDGMAIRDYLQVLKNCGYEDEVKRSHLLWDIQRVRDTYGMPDEEQDRGDYLEWIYKLPKEGTQFDFHFVNGLVVEAH